MPLTESSVRASRPKEKTYRLYDERGLYLEVAPSGGRWWRLKYRHGGKEKRLSLGVYPDVSLRTAREKRDEARSLLAGPGIDPSVHRQTQRLAAANTFEQVAREWHAKQKSSWVSNHADKVLSRLENGLFPWLGSRPIAEIDPPELLCALQRIEKRGLLETARRTKQAAGQVFRYGVQTGRALRDPSQDLKGALRPPKSAHLAAIVEPPALAQLLIKIDSYRGTPIVQAALKLAPLVIVRPGELRHARWDAINFETAEWRIPATAMKMRQPHIVPLARQAVAILKELESAS